MATAREKARVERVSTRLRGLQSGARIEHVVIRRNVTRVFVRDGNDASPPRSIKPLVSHHSKEAPRRPWRLHRRLPARRPLGVDAALVNVVVFLAHKATSAYGAARW